jgi:hypothetical protein
MRLALLRGSNSREHRVRAPPTLHIVALAVCRFPCPVCPCRRFRPRHNHALRLAALPSIVLVYHRIAEPTSFSDIDELDGPRVP